jgi:transcriptional regulator with XRE-family HTH domain
MNELIFQRKQAGLTARAFARAVGVSPQFVNDVERERRLPSMETLGRMADVLGCSADELFRMELRPVGIKQREVQP